MKSRHTFHIPRFTFHAPRSGSLAYGLTGSLLVLALFFAVFALYARTAAPGLLDGDEGEFQTNIARLGVSHTGYPLFFLLGKLWTMLVPVGTLAARANWFAALWGALAVVALYVFTRWLVGNRWIALLCALLLAASRVEWSQAVIPRPYTLNSFFVIVVTALFFLWRAGKVDLTVPVFVFGLSLTNHRTMIWFAPAIALLVLWKERGALFQPRRLLALLIAFALPLLLYGYVFWRGDSDVGVEFHLKDFNEMILAGNANRWMYFGGLDWIVHRVTELYIPLLIEQFTPLGFVLGLVGIVALARDRVPRGWQRDVPAREALGFIALANIANSAFCVFFNTMDVEKFFLPSYITFLFCVGRIFVRREFFAQRLESANRCGARVGGESRTAAGAERADCGTLGVVDAARVRAVCRASAYRFGAMESDRQASRTGFYAVWLAARGHSARGARGATGLSHGASARNGDTWRACRRVSDGACG